MDNLTGVCEENNSWLFNLLLINNFSYDSGYDHFIKQLYQSTDDTDTNVRPTPSCLPYTWFLCVYMQLSVLLPFLLYFFQRYSLPTGIFHALMVVATLLAKFLVINTIWSDL